MAEPADYPAAHSMDSCWFALDLDGRIGYFDTSEDGCMPEGNQFPAGGEAGGYGDAGLELTQLVARVLVARAQTDQRLGSLLPDDLQEINDALFDFGWEVEKLARHLGVYVFHNLDIGPVPYGRGGVVNPGVTVGDLDKRTRALFKNCVLPVRFDEVQQVQPARHLKVAGWSDEWIDFDGTAHSIDGPIPANLADPELARQRPEEWGSEDDFGALADDAAFYAAIKEVFGG